MKAFFYGERRQHESWIAEMIKVLENFWIKELALTKVCYFILSFYLLKLLFVDL